MLLVAREKPPTTAAIEREAMPGTFTGESWLRRTYDTCLRARDIFRVRSALLVTQGYHLDRALLTCDPGNRGAGGNG